MQRAMAYILKIYKKQSFSKAASELFITQPALSAIVKKEEQDYGVTLFNRSVKPIVPTEAGLKYIQTALKIERLETALRRELRSLSNTITIGSAAFFCANVLPPLIQQFLKETKNSCKVEVLEGNASELVTLLQNGDANFIITVDHNYGKGFQHGFLKKETVVLAVPEQFADSPELRSKALPAPPQISPSTRPSVSQPSKTSHSSCFPKETTSIPERTNSSAMPAYALPRSSIWTSCSPHSSPPTRATALRLSGRN